jgi:hypothetical protein
MTIPQSLAPLARVVTSFQCQRLGVGRRAKNGGKLRIFYIYPDSAGTRTNHLPKREIGILLTE